MILYSVQPIDVWEKLQSEKILIADANLGGYYDVWKHAYDWLFSQFKKRINNSDGNHLWWAWTEKPDLRGVRHWYSDELWVRLTLDIPDDLVLLNNYGAWHTCLSGGFLHDSENAQDNFDEKWLRLTNPDNVTLSQLYKNPHLNTIDVKMRKNLLKLAKFSWDKIFDTQSEYFNSYYGCQLQANFEYLKLADVKKADIFKGAVKKPK